MKYTFFETTVYQYVEIKKRLHSFVLFVKITDSMKPCSLYYINHRKLFRNVSMIDIIKPFGHNRTAAERNYVAKTIRRRKESCLQDSFLNKRANFKVLLCPYFCVSSCHRCRS